jgi:hypothetical protein
MNLATRRKRASAADLVPEKTKIQVQSASSFVSPLHAWKKSYKGFLAIAKTQYNSKG